MIAALFVQTNGVYYGLPDVDPWDEQRDAMKYDGPWPVVAHPPCARWSTLAHVNQARYQKTTGWTIGEDGGTFASALESTNIYGGVLEHPAYTMAYAKYGLCRPERGRWKQCCQGWTCEVSQSAYGHRARKRTWLYYVGSKKPFDLDWSDRRGSHGFVGRGSRVEYMGKKERIMTPIPFRDVLIQLAKHAVF